MKKKIKETRAQWDDVPAKVVGRRFSGAGGWNNATILQERINRGLPGKSGWPRGVVRFKSFEEADDRWMKNIHFRTK